MADVRIVSIDPRLHGADIGDACTIVGNAPGLDAMVAELAPDSDGRGKTMLILFHPDSPMTECTVRTAIAVTSAHAAALPLGLPPFAASIVTRLACELAPLITEAGDLFDAVAHLAATVPVAAWTTSVTAVSSAPVGVMQHLRSWLPGSAFAVRLQPDAIVQRPGRPDQPPLLALDPGWTLAAAASAGTEVGPAVRALTGQAPATTLTAPAGLASWWGSGQVVEMVGLPDDPLALVSSLRTPAVRCNWCHERGSGSACVFCGASLGRRTDAMASR